MQFDRSKLRSLVLYTVKKCRGDSLGMTKLHKVLYFSDMLNFAANGVPITGASYRKRPHGPTCDALLGLVRDLKSEGYLAEKEVDYFGYKKREFSVKRKFSNLLADHEKFLVDEVIDFVCNNNSARSISEFSHNAAWDLAEFGHEIPYSSAFFIFPSEVSDESLEWASEEIEKIEDAKSKGSAVGGSNLGDFRKRVFASH